MMDTQTRIKQQVTTNPVVLYMKGSPQFPQCGFSGAAIKMLEACGGPTLFTVDVLTDPEIRNGASACRRQFEDSDTLRRYPEELSF